MGHQSVEPGRTITGHAPNFLNQSFMNKWQKEKPDFKKQCVFVTATQLHPKNKSPFWIYRTYEIKKVEGPDGWYLGLCDGEGDEWGDISDLKADLYLILPKKNNK